MDLIEVTSTVTGVLERLGVSYYICGSLASSVYGEARSTNDADLVAEMKPEHVEPFVAALTDDFYVDDGMIRQAIRRHRSFNVIHFATSHKVDVFVKPQSGYAQEALSRRERLGLGEGESMTMWVSSAEDTVLAKLNWYRLTQETSERQWRDVVSVLVTQKGKLDVDYMRKWAGTLGIAELLEKALTEAGQHGEMMNDE